MSHFKNFSIITFFIVWNCLNHSLEISASTLTDYTAIDFLMDVQRFNVFQNILVVRNRNTTIAATFVNSLTEIEDKNETSVELNHFLVAIMTKLQVNVLQMNELSTPLFLKRYVNDNILSVVILDGLFLENSVLLQKFLINVREMTTSKVLFLSNEAEVNTEYLTKLFHFCWQSKIINVAVLFADYQVRFLQTFSAFIM
ncbi:uncharacterized protein LOC119683775 [Teleopsis dalmanni]|uniref:uncharacterized protein LOC119683775 n=1 Tax=Teleopsis dalmanni TaxID=139649 RepID=UPI0018CDB7A0|nr:uncharacterized protein LOC119683775 [Teleopsis dalmanni]